MMAHIDDNALRQIPLFSNIAPESRELLQDKGRTTRFNKGEAIFIHGESATQFYCLQTGQVRLFRESEDGDEAIIGIAGAPAFLGIADYYRNAIHENNAVCMRDCILFTFPVTLLDMLIAHDSVFARNICGHLAHSLHASDKALELNFTQKASQRIGCFLLRHSGGQVEGAAHIDLPYEKTLVAGMLGMRPETFSRGLGRLKRELGIEIERTRVVIPDIAKLADYTCSACSGEYPCVQATGELQTAE